jgi:hypothetical protein
VVWALPTSTLAWGMITAGAATFLALLGFPSLTAPYGRYSKTGWGLLIPSKLAWVVSRQLNDALPCSLHCAHSAADHAP